MSFDNILNLGSYLLSFVFVLSVIVFIHELGHYLVARWCKIKIVSFSIGFGKEIFGFNDKNGTRWKFCIIPMGGYVQMFGDKDATSSTKEGGLSDQDFNLTLESKNYWQKSAVVLAGPFANFLLSIVILFSLTFSFPITKTKPIIGEVLVDSPAFVSGLQAGDIITKIDNEDIKDFRDIINALSVNLGSDIIVEFNRKGDVDSVLVTPKIEKSQDILGNEIKKAIIGIQVDKNQIEQIELGAIDSLKRSLDISWNVIEKNLTALYQIITLQRSIKDMGGPVKIAKYSGQATSKGIYITLMFMASISISLGLVNLFPIPGLDGGHFLFYTIEKISGKQIPEKYKELIFKISMSLLILLILVITYNDIMGLVKS